MRVECKTPERRRKSVMANDRLHIKSISRHVSNINNGPSRTTRPGIADPSSPQTGIREAETPKDPPAKIEIQADPSATVSIQNTEDSLGHKQTIVAVTEEAGNPPSVKVNIPPPADTQPNVPPEEKAAIAAYEALVAETQRLPVPGDVRPGGRVALLYAKHGKEKPPASHPFWKALQFCEVVAEGKRPSEAPASEVTSAAETVLEVARKLQHLREKTEEQQYKAELDAAMREASEAYNEAVQAVKRVPGPPGMDFATKFDLLHKKHMALFPDKETSEIVTKGAISMPVCKQVGENVEAAQKLSVSEIRSLAADVQMCAIKINELCDAEGTTARARPVTTKFAGTPANAAHSTNTVEELEKIASAAHERRASTPRSQPVPPIPIPAPPVAVPPVAVPPQAPPPPAATATPPAPPASIPPRASAPTTVIRESAPSTVWITPRRAGLGFLLFILGGILVALLALKLARESEHATTARVAFPKGTATSIAVTTTPLSPKTVPTTNVVTTSIPIELSVTVTTPPPKGRQPMSDISFAAYESGWENCVDGTITCTRMNRQCPLSEVGRPVLDCNGILKTKISDDGSKCYDLTGCDIIIP
jgi:hypothetical protein